MEWERRNDGHRDGTKYGLARTATRSFHAYHLCAISTAIVTTHAEILLQAANQRARRCPLAR